MDERDESEDKVVLPAQQQHQPQAARAAKDEGLAACAAPVAGGLLGGEKAPGGSEPNEDRRPFDQARFNAGMVRFYEAVLKEPIPEKMLRLVDEIAKRERES
jgi:hypothetical protein